MNIVITCALSQESGSALGCVCCESCTVRNCEGVHGLAGHQPPTLRRPQPAAEDRECKCTPLSLSCWAHFSPVNFPSAVSGVILTSLRLNVIWARFHGAFLCRRAHLLSDFVNKSQGEELCMRTQSCKAPPDVRAVFRSAPDCLNVHNRNYTD